MFGIAQMKVCDTFKRSYKGLHLARKSDGLLEQLATAYSFNKLLLFMKIQLKKCAVMLYSCLRYHSYCFLLANQSSITTKKQDRNPDGQSGRLCGLL